MNEAAGPGTFAFPSRTGFYAPQVTVGADESRSNLLPSVQEKIRKIINLRKPRTRRPMPGSAASAMPAASADGRHAAVDRQHARLIGSTQI